jgi:hypothetical protein
MAAGGPAVGKALDNALDPLLCAAVKGTLCKRLGAGLGDVLDALLVQR